jgi:ribonuclease T2
MNVFKRNPKGGAALLGLVAMLAAAMFGGNGDARRYGKAMKSKAGQFDYYTLVLSWSPTYCDSNAGRRDRLQCGAGRKYAFVLHGLWPQHEKGWPQFCRVKKGNYYVSNKVLDSMLDIMPSRKLVIHEWKKHGTCSGLHNRDYFAVSRQLFKSVNIPRRYVRPNNFITTSPGDLKSDFLKANPQLKDNMISVQCGRRKRLREIRICYDRDLKPRPCGRNEKRACRAKSLVLPPGR